jgi:hypothetical protein
MCDPRVELIKPIIFDLQVVKLMHLILKNIMKMNLIYLKLEVARDRGGVDKTDLERLDQAFVEVPNKEVNKFNLIKSFFKPWFPVRLRKHPPFGATVPSQCTPICAG